MKRILQANPATITLFGPAVGLNVICDSEVLRRNDSEPEMELCPVAAWTVMTPKSSDKAVSFRRSSLISWLDESFGRMAARASMRVDELARQWHIEAPAKRRFEQIGVHLNPTLAWSP